MENEIVKNLNQIHAWLRTQGTDKTSYDTATIHSQDLLHSKDVEKAEMTVGLSCAMYMAQV